MRKMVTGLAMLVLLGVFPGAAFAQSPTPGPEQERMAQMMKMMEQMQGQMKQMREQMTEQKSSMMQQHRAEMQKACHGAAASAEPK
jgi:uncharacterized membrane protein (DUF106 family)